MVLPGQLDEQFNHKYRKNNSFSSLHKFHTLFPSLKLFGFWYILRIKYPKFWTLKNRMSDKKILIMFRQSQRGNIIYLSVNFVLCKVI